MANGLAACGWVEEWVPDVSLQTFKGLLHALNFETNADVSVITDLSAPNGVALVGAGTGGGIETPVDAILSGWGQSSDWLAMHIWKNTVDLFADQSVSQFYIGDNATDGFLNGQVQNGIANYDVKAEIPGGDSVYYDLLSTGAPFASNVWNISLVWWTLTDKTLHNQTNNGTEYTLNIPAGAGAPESNYALWQWSPANIGFPSYSGGIAACKAPIPDSTQRSLLFGGLPFSQWDSGGAAIPQRAASGQYAIRTH